jgi:hypothetical protein
MVQVGNEVVSGMIWDVGKNYNPGSWSNFAALVNAGIDGVRDIDQNIKIMMHTINERSPNGWLTNLINAGATRIDVIALSYYTQWHGQPDSLRREVNRIANNALTNTHNIKIAVAEYSGNHRLVNDIIFELPNNKGFGTFVWEPADWSDGSYGAVLFDWNNGRRSNANLELYPQMAIDYGTNVVTPSSSSRAVSSSSRAVSSSSRAVSSSSRAVSSSSRAVSSSSRAVSSSSVAQSSSSGGIVPVNQPQIANAIRIQATGNIITLENLPNNTKVEVYDLYGKLVYSQFSTLNSQLIKVQTNGIYIVKVGNRTFRIPVI